MTTEDARRLPNNDAPSGDQRALGPEVIVEEHELSRIEGERLYTLSPFAGLSVTDVSKSKAALLGRRYERGTPAGMYVRGDRVFALFTNSGAYVEDPDAEMTRWVHMNRLVVLDIADLSSIEALDEIIFPGKLVDSRVRGDNLYVVTDEDGACFRCAETLRTLVRAFHVSNEGAIVEADQLSYDFKRGSSHSSVVAAGKQHLYVVSWEYPWVDETQRSTIEVIGVADPGGMLEAGRRITAGGVVWNRWQMHELSGVLRVATESVVETFEVTAPSEAPPLGVLNLGFASETVRFDGARAYVSGSKRLAVLDLADPASPMALGELELERRLDHLEPRGDRVVALDGPGWPSRLVLLDVADPAVPKLLDRVGFEMGEPPYFRDPRIHQALSINEGDGLIAVPLVGSLDGADVCHVDTSAMALVEWASDELRTASEIGTRGATGRAFLHAGRLYSASAERVEVFDIEDPEDPTELGSVPLYDGAGQMIRVRDRLVRLSADWTEAPTLEVTSLEKLARSEPGPRLLLAAPDACSNHGRFGNAQLFAYEDFLVMIRTDYGEESHHHVLEVFRIGDGVPEFVSSMRLPPGEYCVQNAFAEGVGCSMGAVQIGTTLVIPSVPGPDFFEADPVSTTYQLQVLDLRDPKNPRHVRTLERGPAAGVGPLELDGSLVVGSRWIKDDDSDTQLRFYADRFDFSDPKRPS